MVVASLAARPDVASAGLTVTLPLSGDVRIIARSEEHTSELQSRFDLVCRLLLEKKKKKKIINIIKYIKNNKNNKNNTMKHNNQYIDNTITTFNKSLLTHHHV